MDKEVQDMKVKKYTDSQKQAIVTKFTKARSAGKTINEALKATGVDVMHASVKRWTIGFKSEKPPVAAETNTRVPSINDYLAVLETEIAKARHVISTCEAMRALLQSRK